MNECYICSRPADERDHFPLSKSLGGVETRPICTACHDLKDRIKIDDWNPGEFAAALTRLWSKATADERLVLAKIFHIANQGVATLRILNLRKSSS